jgi:hypothetical protein
MKTKLLVLSALVISLCLAACKKDKFTTKPQLEFKSFNSSIIGPGQQLIITLHYTDREGDIQNYLYIERNVANCLKDSIRDSQNIPTDVPARSDAEGDIVIRYSYSPDFTYPLIGEPTCAGNDTCIYRFALSDKAGNVSDTISTPPLVILKR